MNARGRTQFAPTEGEGSPLGNPSTNEDVGIGRGRRLDG